MAAKSYRVVGDRAAEIDGIRLEPGGRAQALTDGQVARLAASGIAVIEAGTAPPVTPTTRALQVTALGSNVVDLSAAPEGAVIGKTADGSVGALPPVGSAVLPPGMFPAGIYGHGDSLSAGYGGHHFPFGGWVGKLAVATRSTYASLAIPGAIGSAKAAWSQILQADSTSVKTDTGWPWRAWPGGDRLTTIGYGFNDLNERGGQAAIPSLVSAMRAMVSRSMAYRIAEDDQLIITGPSGTFGGWSPVNATDRNSGSGYYETSTNGDSLHYQQKDVLPGMAYVIGGPVAKGTVGFLDVTVGGVAHGTVDLAAAAAVGAGDFGTWCYRVDDIPPYAPQFSHDVIATVRGLTAGKAMCDYMHVEAPVPPPILVRGVTRPVGTNPYWASSVAQRDADIAACNVALRALVAEFERPGGVNPVRFLDADAVIDKDPAAFADSVTDSGAPLNDGLHWGDEGYRRVAEEAYRELLAYAGEVARGAAIGAL